MRAINENRIPSNIRSRTSCDRFEVVPLTLGVDNPLSSKRFSGESQEREKTNSSIEFQL